MCFIRRLFIHSMLYSFAHLSISGHGSVVSETENWRSSRADVFFLVSCFLVSCDAVFFRSSRADADLPTEAPSLQGVEFEGAKLLSRLFFW